MSQDKRTIKLNEANENLEVLKKEKRKTIYHIIIIAIVALIVIIALCIAWFVSNTRVKGTGATVSADMKNVELKTHGSAGIHDDLLKKIMDQENPTENSWYQMLKNSFLETSPDKYSVNWLLSDQSKVGNYSTAQSDWEDWEDWEKYWKDSNHKREDQAIEPGSSGRLQFSVVPKTAGNITLNMQLSLIPYKYQDNKLEEADEITKTFTSGHILFFLEESKSSNAGNASATSLIWLKDGSFTLDIPTAQKDTEYSYTLYWCWPQNFAEFTLAEGDEFLNGRKPILSTYKNGETVRNAIAYADTQYSMVNCPQRYFYSNLTQQPLPVGQTELSKIQNMQTNFSNEETKDAFVALSSYYNQADQYIGSHANCLRVKLEMQPMIQN